MRCSSIVSLTTDPAYIIIYDEAHFPWVNLHVEEGRFDFNLETGRWDGHATQTDLAYFERIILEASEGFGGWSIPFGLPLEEDVFMR